MTNPALDHITYSIYECQDCFVKRALADIPAVIDGVVSEEAPIEFCSQCDSSNIKVLFRTKSRDEFMVYSQIVTIGDEDD